MQGHWLHPHSADKKEAPQLRAWVRIGRTVSGRPGSSCARTKHIDNSGVKIRGVV
jgi:hypothetical protein